MDEIDKRRKKEFQQHEMEKEHKRRKEEKGFDEAKKKEVEEERKRLREKHVKDAERVNHPVSKCTINKSQLLDKICSRPQQQNPSLQLRRVS
jgi:HSP90 family molecular chaperone